MFLLHRRKSTGSHPPRMLVSGRIRVRRKDRAVWNGKNTRGKMMSLLSFPKVACLTYPSSHRTNTKLLKDKEMPFSSSSTEFFQTLPMQFKSSCPHWDNTTLVKGKWSPFILAKWITAKLFSFLWPFPKSPCYSLKHYWYRHFHQKRKTTKNHFQCLLKGWERFSGQILHTNRTIIWAPLKHTFPSLIG